MEAPLTRHITSDEPRVLIVDGSKVAPGPRFKEIRDALLEAARGGPERASDPPTG